MKKVLILLWTCTLIIPGQPISLLRGLTVAYAIPETDIVAALKFPGMMIGSDTIIEIEKNNHPRGAGCYARLFQKYVREEKIITLMEAVRMCSYYPAKRLEKIAATSEALTVPLLEQKTDVTK